MLLAFWVALAVIPQIRRVCVLARRSRTRLARLGGHCYPNGNHSAFGVAVGVRLGVGVKVGVGVSVGRGVKVVVGVLVGLGVAVGDGVTVGVGDAMGVGVGISR